MSTTIDDKKWTLLTVLMCDNAKAFTHRLPHNGKQCQKSRSVAYTHWLTQWSKCRNRTQHTELIWCYSFGGDGGGGLFMQLARLIHYLSVKMYAMHTKLPNPNRLLFTVYTSTQLLLLLSMTVVIVQKYSSSFVDQRTKPKNKNNFTSRRYNNKVPRNSLSNSLAHSSMNEFIEKLLRFWLAGWLSDWPTGWLTGWSTTIKLFIVSHTFTLVKRIFSILWLDERMRKK